MNKQKGYEIESLEELHALIKSESEFKNVAFQNIDLSETEKEAIAHDLSIKLGQYFAHIGTAWHEILTWFGYRSVILYPEFPSAFSWEDSFSNVLGTHLAAKAIRDSEHSYDEAMTLAIDHELEKLVVQPKRVAMRASEKVKGTWSTGEFLFSDALFSRIQEDTFSFLAGFSAKTFNFSTSYFIPVAACINSAKIDVGGLQNMHIIKEFFKAQ